MKAKRSLAFLASVCFLMSVSAGSIQSSQKDEPLLDQSLTLSQNLDGHERLNYLINLCDISDRLNLPPEKQKEYALALFRLASTDQDSEWRAVGQKNAVSCLSYADSVAAMEFLPKISFQPPSPGQPAFEDPRFNTADRAFTNFLNQEKITSQSVSTVIARARYLGQTGQYPYVAAANVISRLPASFKDEANTLLRDALGFYASETGFLNRDEEFLRLLVSLRNPSIDAELAARSATTFVQRLKTDPIGFPGNYYAEVHIAPSGKVFPFVDRNDAFLFRAFPAIRRFNPILAAQLRQQDAKLGEATDNMLNISGGFVPGDPTSQETARQHVRLLQRSLLKRIKERQDCNPQAALDLAQRLADVSSRIVGFSAAIPATARTDPSRARSLYEKQLSDLGNLGDPTDKLRAMVALVPAAYHLGDLNAYQSLTGQAFEIGLRVLNSESAAGPHDPQHFAELRDLVTFTASQPGDPLATRVQNLPDGWLKAYLMLHEAEGRAKGGAPPTTGPCPA